MTAPPTPRGTTLAAPPTPRVLPFAQRIARGLANAGFRFHIHGIENVPPEGPLLTAGNHSSFLDGPFVFAALPRPAVFLIKSELYHGPVGRGLVGLGQIPIDRSRADRAALRRAREHLAAGHVVGIFPEGTRGSGEFNDAKHGVAYLALGSGAPVLPIAVLGTLAALPMGSHRPTLRVPIDVVIGAPFAVPVTGDPRNRRVVAVAAAAIQDRLVEHLAAARSLVAARDTAGALP